MRLLGFHVQRVGELGVYFFEIGTTDRPRRLVEITKSIRCVAEGTRGNSMVAGSFIFFQKLKESLRMRLRLRNDLKMFMANRGASVDSTVENHHVAVWGKLGKNVPSGLEVVGVQRVFLGLESESWKDELGSHDAEFVEDEFVRVVDVAERPVAIAVGEGVGGGGFGLFSVLGFGLEAGRHPELELT